MYKLRRSSLVYKIAFFWVEERDRKECTEVTRIDLVCLLVRSCFITLLLMVLAAGFVGCMSWQLYEHFFEFMWGFGITIGGIAVVVIGSCLIVTVFNWSFALATKEIPIVDE
ncbi:hypothetical protein FJY93_02805 [Candidatus Kaiserbacteria bacterium]|nr:hypothetical protein [Candidatus Kaiserbacteria bacterium]